jgi:nucleoside-diphosphate kinase
MSEKTLILIKPDGVKRGLIGQILTRIEQKGYEIVAMKKLQATPEMLNQHYNQLVDKPFFPSIVEYMTSGEIVAIVAQGDEIITTFRQMMGATNPSAALPGTIRGDFARNWGSGQIQNIVHGSDSLEAFEKESNIWFT